MTKTIYALVSIARPLTTYFCGQCEVFAWVLFAEANSSEKPDIRPGQMAEAISGCSLINTQEFKSGTDKILSAAIEVGLMTLVIC